MPDDETESKQPNSKRRRANNSKVACEPEPDPPPYRSSSSPDSTASHPNVAKWFRNPSVVWFRGHDLRVEDHPALLAAAQRGGPVVPLFIWDEEDQFGRDLGNMKRWWLKRSLHELSDDLKKLGVQLYTRVGRSTVELRKFITATGADAVFWNRCYEPDLLQRDEKMRAELGQDGMTAESFKAELLVEPWELSSSNVLPAFKTFHEYMRAWMAFPPPPQPFPCPSRLQSLQSISKEVKIGDIDSLGLDCPNELAEELCKFWIPGSAQGKAQLEIFLKKVFPAFGDTRYRRHFKGTSRLSPHVRFGELSPRRMYHATRICVSRWDPNSNMASPLAATVGLSSLVFAKEHKRRRTAKRRSRPLSKKGMDSEDGESDSDSSACSSPHPNFGNGSMNRANGTSYHKDHSTKNAPQPSERQAPNGRAHERRESSPSSEMPHISMSAKAFLKNLCLRDFSYHVLFHHPDFHAKPIVPEFSRFPWASDDGTFDAWRNGKTGYPIVDAAMRELQSTGWIHNAMRFLLACFLTKYLLLPWQRGLKEFYVLLMDGDHSANALGWQWTSGSNTDSFPFSCLVNPVKIALRLDPTGEYVRQWVPELAKLPLEFLHQPWKAPESMLSSVGLNLGVTYPKRIVEPSQARRRAKEAMLLMKQVFAAMRPSRIISTETVDDLLRDWPGDSDAEGENSYSDVHGKAGLLPSLWSLLKCQDSADVSTIGNCAVENTLSNGQLTGGVTPAANGDSIEHVLLSAHSTLDSAGLSVDTFNLMDGNRSQATRIAPAVTRRDSVGRAKPIEARSIMQNEASPDTPGSRSTLIPNSQHLVKENGAPATSLPQHSVAVTPRMPGFGGIHQLPVVQRHHQPTVLLPMQVNQMHHRPANHHQIAGNAVVFDPVYGTAVAPSHGAPVPMPNFPVMMGPGHPNVEVGMPNSVNHSDFNNHTLYSHQMMYGLPFQMMQSQRLAGSEGDQPLNHGVATSTTISGAAIGTRHVGIPPNFPVAYGMYGNHAFDSSSFANVVNDGDVGQYAPVHIAPHQAAAPRVLPRTPQHMITPHHLYMPPAVAPEGMHRGNSSYGTGRPPNHSSHPTVFANGHGAHRESSPMTIPEHSTSLTDSKSVEGDITRQRRKSIQAGKANMGSKGTNIGSQSSPRRTKAMIRRGNASPRVALGGVTKAVSGIRRTVSKTGVPRTLTATRGRSASRGKRSSGSRSARNRSESRSSGAEAGSSNIPESGLAKRSRSDGESVASALKARQQTLDTVSQNEKHEYYHFAQFLTKTYELTKNTDRHTSKDYIRLCTLKDNYHKQCESDKEKLKIYTIKAFFSKILELEVTGEWDRHNHGGVRGPYVYGIRLKPNKSSDPARKGAD